MFDRSAILRSAWEGYRRDQKAGLGVLRYGPFSRSHFAYCLRMAWRVAKERAAKAAAVAVVEVKPAPVLSPRAVAIKAELLAQEYGDFINWSERRALQNELAALVG